MSPYERERRSNVFRGGGHVSPMEERQNRAKGLWTLGGFRRQRGGRTQSRRLTDAGGGARLWVNHGHRGACEPALNPRRRWEDPRKKGQGFKPDSGNPTVRDYRGASGNVATAEMRSHVATERAGMVTLHLQADAPEFYPNPTRKEKATPSWP